MDLIYLGLGTALWLAALALVRACEALQAPGGRP